jgi:ketosteroid isomerase-like protein
MAMTGLHVPIVLAAVVVGAASLDAVHAQPTANDQPQRKTIMTNDSSQQEINKAIVKDRFAAWANGTGSPFELLDESATWTITGRSAASKTYPNREAFMTEVIGPFNARMQAPLKPTVHNIYADGNAVVIFFDARTIARDGKPYVNTYAWFFEMRDRKVVKATAMFDSVEFNEMWSRVQPVP